VDIVILTPYLPYPGVPHGGGHDLLRLIEFLGQRHAVRVAAFADAATARRADGLRSLVAELRVIEPAIGWPDKARRAWAALRAGQWRTLGRRAEREVQAAVGEWSRLGQVDVLYCAWTEMGRYLRLAPPRAARVLDEVDVRFLVEAAAARARPWQWPRAWLRRRAELAQARAAHLVVTRSARDLRALQAAAPEVRGLVLPPAAHTAALLAAPLEAAVPGRVLFAGALDRARNQQAARWLAEAVWPRLRAGCPAAELRLVGANPPPALRALARPGLSVTGWVDDLAAEYAQARVVAAPLFGEAGALNKVLDGLAAGRPVVGTPQANAGVQAPPEAFFAAETPEAFARHILDLLTDDARWQAAARAARAFARAAFDWPAAAARLEAALLALTA
jgi:glycosyltransferase involved in cell wall biosynthesis